MPGRELHCRGFPAIDSGAKAASGEARAGDDVSEGAWALPAELAGYALTPATHRAIAAARG